MEGFGKRTGAACGQADLDSKCNISLVFIDIYRGFVAVAWITEPSLLLVTG